jgi:hypothetical protein
LTSVWAAPAAAGDLDARDRATVHGAGPQVGQLEEGLLQRHQAGDAEQIHQLLLGGELRRLHVVGPISLLDPAARAVENRDERQTFGRASFKAQLVGQ